MGNTNLNMLNWHGAIAVGVMAIFGLLWFFNKEKVVEVPPVEEVVNVVPITKPGPAPRSKGEGPSANQPQPLVFNYDDEVVTVAPMVVPTSKPVVAKKKPTKKHCICKKKHCKVVFPKYEAKPFVPYGW